MENLCKIRFPLEDGPFSGETAWAEQVSDDTYRLRNVPYHAVGYAEDDVVKTIERDGWPEVIGLVEESGNGTLRLLFADSATDGAQNVLDELTSLGCTYERASDTFVAVTVPPTLSVPFSQVANYLNDLPDDVLVGWEVGKRLTRQGS
jgi:hypothetical protein